MGEIQVQGMPQTSESSDHTSIGEQPMEMKRRPNIGQMLLPYAAPATAAITATLYIAGYQRYYNLTLWYGINSGIIKISIDQTLASGYLALSFMCLATYLYIKTITASGWIYSKIRHTMRPFWLKNPWSFQSKKLKSFVDKKIPNPFLGLLLTSLTIGFSSGAIFGYLEAFLNDLTMKHMCSTFCYVYDIGSTKIVGIPVISDENTSIIKTKFDVRLVKNDSIKSITPW